MSVKVANKEVGKLGYGLMGLTWRDPHISEDEAIVVMKKAYDEGATFWNGGEFYGAPEPTLNLQLIKKFFQKYPELHDKIFLSIKGGVDLKKLAPNGTREGVRTSVENVVKILDGSKKVDLFECARVDPNVPVETTMEALAELVKEGKIGSIGLSECSAQTIRRCVAVHPVAAVEIEYSLFSLEAESNGVIDTCKELGIPIVAYSPLGRGLLTGAIKKIEDVPDGDFRKHFDRFQPDNLQHNLKLVEEVETIAKEKGCTPAQLAISWILNVSNRGTIIPIPGSTSVDRLVENMNALKIQLSDAEADRLTKLAQSANIQGGRYNAHSDKLLWG
eukprot:TRINITY_DN652_c0_g2_i1.p1 TRINITY_DN652_c0_g2~~TRINITY_DN652_c0_g2_i1.p1  ORF type:complete len:332 (+),score=119.47 TRINITY_DN652_c0_g2_i1:62-1057(+)